MASPTNYIDLLSELKQRESQLLSEIAAVRAAIVAIGRAQISANPSMGISSPGDRTPYRNLSILRASVDFLQSQGRPQGSTEIAKALVAGGYRSTSKAFYRTVFNVLMQSSKKRSAEIVKSELGFGLAEWKPPLQSADAKTGPQIQGRASRVS